MAIRPKFVGFPPGVTTYVIKIYRDVDNKFWDFLGLTFVASGGTETNPIAEDTTVGNGCYRQDYGPTPVATFTNGNYTVFLLDASGAVLSASTHVMTNGDDATTITLPQYCVAVSGSPSSIVVSGLPVAPGGAPLIYAVPGSPNNQSLVRGIGGEARIIASQSYSAPNYTFNFGTGAAKLGPFSYAPVAGDIFFPMP